MPAVGRLSARGFVVADLLSTDGGVPHVLSLLSRWEWPGAGGLPACDSDRPCPFVLMIGPQDAFSSPPMGVSPTASVFVTGPPPFRHICSPFV
nr:hypothetical protein Itr_chr01CG05760 [Ipomoea trifida]